MITQAVPPREIRILPRGNWMDKSGKVVQPHAPHFLKQLDTGGRRANRLDLANWLVSRDNPLTARVVVNRLWKLYFGTGLSKVLIDMGSRGEVPPNQELLDWLAIDFMDHGWDMKHMIRQMVTTSAYRQSSLPRPEVDAIDPDNRLVAHQSRFRLEAEQIRDNALLVSGLLVNKLGGDIVKPYQPAKYYAVAQLSRARLHGLDGRRPIPPGRVHALAAAVPASVPARVRCADARGMHRPAADFQHADRGTCAAERSVVRRSSPRAGGQNAHVRCAGDDNARIHWAWRQVLGAMPSRPKSNVLTKLLKKHRARICD